MKVSVLADDDGIIIAIARCSMSASGEIGTFTNDAEIRAEITRSALDAHLGRTPPTDQAAADALVTSVIVELPREFHDLTWAESTRHAPHAITPRAALPANCPGLLLPGSRPYERLRRSARNIASVPCRCGQNWACGPSPRSPTSGR